MYNIDQLRREFDLEQLAREAEKATGISRALNIALTECKGNDASELAGAFDAMEDITQGLAADLQNLAESVAV